MIEGNVTIAQPLTVEWVDSGEEGYGDADPRLATAPEAPCGGMGGWVSGESWAQYVAEYKPEERPYLEAVRASVLAGTSPRYGEEMNEKSALFSDGTQAGWSWRAWGDLVAAVFNGDEPGPFGYMDFYMWAVSDQQWPPDRAAATLRAAERAERARSSS